MTGLETKAAATVTASPQWRSNLAVARRCSGLNRPCSSVRDAQCAVCGCHPLVAGSPFGRVCPMMDPMCGAEIRKTFALIDKDGDQILTLPEMELMISKLMGGKEPGRHAEYARALRDRV